MGFLGRGGQVDYQRFNIADIGYRLVERQENQYLGAKVASFKMDLNPRPEHVDALTTITTPLQKPGAYLLTAKVAGGNTSRIIVWLADTVLLKKQLDGQAYYFAADAATLVSRGGGSRPELHAALTRGVEALAYRLRPAARALIIGPGGGNDVIAARLLGARELVAVEVNPIIAKDVMSSEPFKSYSGALYEQPGVRLVVAEGRSYLRRSSEQFDVVLCLGLLDHVHRPFELFALMARSGAELLVIDTEVSRARLSLFELARLYNAADATQGEGSMIRVITENKAIRQNSDHPIIVIRVIDNGIGIPREHLERVFDPFFTTKPAGSGVGLGLSLCQRIILSNKGTIRVDSELGKGTQVTILLPAHELVTSDAHAAAR